MNGLELFHYGIKGMRWGVRKNKNSYSSRQPTPAEKTNLKKMYRTYQDASSRSSVARQKVYSKYEPELEKLYSAYNKMTDWKQAEHFYETKIATTESRMYKEASEAANEYRAREDAARNAYHAASKKLVKKYLNTDIDTLDRDMRDKGYAFVEAILLEK